MSEIKLLHPWSAWEGVLLGTTQNLAFHTRYVCEPSNPWPTELVAQCNNGYMVNGEYQPTTGWHFYVCRHPYSTFLSSLPENILEGYADSLEEAKTKCDECLTEQGWILAESEQGQKYMILL